VQRAGSRRQDLTAAQLLPQLLPQLDAERRGLVPA
jgi:hypothetical protein